MHLFCLYWFPLIFTHININFYEKSAIFVIVVFENCVSLTGIPILNANLTFFGMSQCSIYHICLALTLIPLKVTYMPFMKLLIETSLFFSLKTFHIHK